jgi:anti-anti-sigma factor
MEPAMEPAVESGAVAAQFAAGPAWVVVAQGELDLESLPPLREALSTAATAYPVVVLDLSAVTFGDSTFLGVLFTTHPLNRLRVAGAGETLQRLFDVVGAEAVLDTYDTVADALAAD